MSIDERMTNKQLGYLKPRKNSMTKQVVFWCACVYMQTFLCTCIYLFIVLNALGHTQMFAVNEESKEDGKINVYFALTVFLCAQFYERLLKIKCKKVQPLAIIWVLLVILLFAVRLLSFFLLSIDYQIFCNEPNEQSGMRVHRLSYICMNVVHI